jgi:malate dehydrogenase (oxaloacetate-decarboxylating)(NADP+)
MQRRRSLSPYEWQGALRVRQPVRSSDDRGQTFVPRQGNNSYIFPGVGLGAIASGAQRITDEMFMAAAETLAKLVSEADLAQGSLYPALPRIREVSAQIAAAVARVAYDQGFAIGPVPTDLLGHVTSQMYEPLYSSYV